MKFAEQRAGEEEVLELVMWWGHLMEKINSCARKSRVRNVPLLQKGSNVPLTVRTD